MSFQPVIIVGAARSGTNMLRDVLTQLPGVATWPCDEINYIWRHGHVSHPTDEFTAEMATPSVTKFIRRAFQRQAQRNNSPLVLEKTCANSLRVDFVHRVVPNAKFIFLIRDGRDVALSAAKRWTADMDWSYVLRKARYVPLVDLPYYATQYATNRFARLRSADRRLATWGPRFQGLQFALRQLPLVDVCGLQWQRSVKLSTEQLASIEPQRIHQLHYESFVQKPGEHLQKIVQFLGLNVPANLLHESVKQVSVTRTGGAMSPQNSEVLERLNSLLHTTLEAHGYSSIPHARQAVLPMEGSRRPVHDPQGTGRRAG